MIQKNAVIGQSGGPTCAINSSLAGVINALLKSEKIDRVYGMVNGINGILNENLKELNTIFESEENLNLLKLTPSSYLGSCRFKMPEEDSDNSVYEKVFNVLEKHNISYFFYIGGNDSMDTVMKLDAYSKKHNKNVTVIGIPKTIDNDLFGTDHCPGFGSAAKYVATTVAEVARDAYCYFLDSVTIVEIMGRNAGFLTAAAALARGKNLKAPNLIYLPERPFDIITFLEDVKEQITKHKNVIVAVSEGIKNKDGVYISADTDILENDKFGHAQLGGAAKTLEQIVKKEIGCKCRSIEINVLQRAASHFPSKTDLDEAFLVGEKAAEYALDGQSGKMMVFEREEGSDYKLRINALDINLIANKEKKMPDSFINDKGNDVTEEFIKYARPLIMGEEAVITENGIPVHLVLDK